MTDENNYEQTEQVDYSTVNYGMEPYTETHTIGTVSRAALGGTSAKGYRPFTISLEFPEDSPDKITETVSINFHPQYMAPNGTKDAPLTANQIKGVNINKRRLNDLAAAGGLTLGEMMQYPDRIVGARVEFTLGPRNDDPSRPELKSIYAPR